MPKQLCMSGTTWLRFLVKWQRTQVMEESSALCIGDQRSKSGGQSGRAFSSTFMPQFEVDPAFIEAIHHSYTGVWVLHSLRTEQLFPAGARNNLTAHGVSQSASKSGSHIVGGITLRAFQFSNAHTLPRLSQEINCRPGNVSRRHHRNPVVERLQKAVHYSRLRVIDVPCCVLHEPCRSQKTHRY